LISFSKLLKILLAEPGYLLNVSPIASDAESLPIT